MDMPWYEKSGALYVTPGGSHTWDKGRAARSDTKPQHEPAPGHFWSQETPPPLSPARTQAGKIETALTAAMP